MERISVLLVANDQAMLKHLIATLQANTRLSIQHCSSADEALACLDNSNHQIVYADWHIDDMPGVTLVQKIKKMLPHVYVIVGAMTSTARDVIEALQAGVGEYIVDPYDSPLIHNAFEKAEAELLKGKSSSTGNRSFGKKIITNDPALNRTLEIAKKVAPSTANVLITGESGTGKELMASFIHQHCTCNSEPYVAVNCAALPEQLAESELFGHEKGAFTGAINRKIGKFESAGKGTLVLDEITEMAMPLQSKLLRALQEREIMRLGSNRPVSVDARVIAISNRNIKKAVQDGIFREDLFYRLNVIPLTIPPLRERKNDIPLLADYFLKHFSAQNAKSMASISDEAMQCLIGQNWPGNVRELENTIQRGVLIGSGDVLLSEHLILEEADSEAVRAPRVAVGTTVREMEKELIFNTLESVNDNRTHAAKMLGISIRTLRNKLNEYREEVEVPEG